jgi:uncharacterized protein YceH (UPF0502 family)
MKLAGRHPASLRGIIVRAHGKRKSRLVRLLDLVVNCATKNLDGETSEQ